MNSIIGQRRNQQQNKKNQNRVNFCSSFSFYVWLTGKTIISSKIVYVSRENMESKEKNVPQTQRQIFLLFPVFKKSPVGRVL